MRALMGLLGLLTMLGLGAPAAERQPQDASKGATCELKIEGMSCGACAARFEREARKIDGVTAATVDHPTARATITYDAAKTSPATIAEIVTKRSGFTATVIKGTP